MTALQDLREQPLFADLSDERLQKLAGQVEERILEEGELLASPGEKPKHFVLLAAGKLSTTTSEADGPATIQEHLPPTYLGAIPLLGDGLHGVAMRALERSRLQLLGVEHFFELLRCEPAVARTIFARFAPVFARLEGQRAERDKLVALGQMSAGLAHELNNPASSAASAAFALEEVLAALEDAPRALAEAGVGAPALAAARAALDAAVVVEAGEDPLTAADREDALGAWLDDHDVPNAWDAAATLADAGLPVEAVAPVVDGLEPAAAAALLGWLSAAAQARAHSAGLRDDAKRIKTLVHAVKVYSHMDGAPEADVDVKEGIESTLTMLGHKLKKGSVTLVREYDPGLPKISARVAALNQVFTNLIVNALDAIAYDGTITVRTRQDGDAVVIEVVDSGPGVPEDKRSRIFEPFYTTKGVGVGTGLGLDISHRIVHEHGGTLVLCDDTGPTTFRVRLPRAQPGGDAVEPRTTSVTG